MGVQFVIAFFLATILNLNRPASFVTVWITNVATVAPIYTFNYWVGSKFWSGPSVAEVYRTFLDLTAKLMGLNIWDIWDQFKIVMSLGQDIIIPLIIGSVIVGLIAAIIVYVASLALLKLLVVRRSKKRILY